MRWLDKPYHSLNYALQKQFGEKIYKLSLNGGMTCPTRDGTLDTRGCIFCSAGGSGDFAPQAALSIQQQIEEQKLLRRAKHTGNRYIAYFQAFTNTYAPIETLRALFREAIAHPDVAGLSIATRPDCLDMEKVELLAELNAAKPVWVELGLQTIHPGSAAFIRRGYDLACFEQAAAALDQAGLAVIVHTILGLPGESASDMLDTVRWLNRQPISGIKLQMLHVLEGTDLAAFYREHPFPVLTLEEYTDILIRCIEQLSPDIVLHRLTGDGPRKLLIQPDWSANKKQVLNYIHKEFKRRDTWQGKCFQKGEFYV